MAGATPAGGAGAPGGETREKLRNLLRRGALDEREVELELDDPGGGSTMSIFTPQGVEEMGVQFNRITSYNVCYTKLLRDKNNYSLGGFQKLCK